MRRFFGFRSASTLPVPPDVAPDQESPTCPRCAASLAEDDRYLRYRVCSACGAHLTIGSRQRIESLVDEGSFRETEAKLFSADPLAFTDDAPYRQRLEEQRRLTGQADALITGTAALHGHRVVLAALDFAFMGGSMGVVVGEKLVRAAELAGERRVPLLTIVADFMGLAGGGLLSRYLLDLPWQQFFSRLDEAIAPTTFWAGLVKAPVFGVLIALTGTLRGLQVRDSSRELGRLTTVAVVQSIFLVIFADALFAMFFLEIDF